MVAVTEVGYNRERKGASRERRHRSSRPRNIDVAQFPGIDFSRVSQIQ